MLSTLREIFVCSEARIIRLATQQLAYNCWKQNLREKENSGNGAGSVTVTDYSLSLKLVRDIENKLFTFGKKESLTDSTDTPPERTKMSLCFPSFDR